MLCLFLSRWAWICSRVDRCSQCFSCDVTAYRYLDCAWVMVQTENSTTQEQALQHKLCTEHDVVFN